jgi:hypothetical protein
MIFGKSAELYERKEVGILRSAKKCKRVWKMMKRKGKEDEVRERCPAIREEMTGARSEMRGTAPPGFL